MLLKSCFKSIQNDGDNECLWSELSGGIVNFHGTHNWGEKTFCKVRLQLSIIHISCEFKKNPLSGFWFRVHYVLKMGILRGFFKMAAV